MSVSSSEGFATRYVDRILQDVEDTNGRRVDQIIDDENLEIILDGCPTIQSLEAGDSVIEELLSSSFCPPASLLDERFIDVSEHRVIGWKNVVLLKLLNKKFYPEDDSAWLLALNGGTCDGKLRCPSFWANRRPKNDDDIIDHLHRKCSVKSKVFLRPPKNLDCEVQELIWSTTLAERDEGLLAGPFDLDELPDSVQHVVPRFAIWQKTRYRMIDDARIFNCSAKLDKRVPLPSPLQALAAATVTARLQSCPGLDKKIASCFSFQSRKRKSPVSVPADAFEALAKLLVESSDELENCFSLDDSIEGIVIDVKGAYKTLGILKGHEYANFLVVFDPSRRKYVAFEGKTLLFGNTHSVVCWCRVAFLINAILRRVFRIPSSVFIDDYHAFVKAKLGRPAADRVCRLLDILGWEYKFEKVEVSDSAVLLLGLLFQLRGKPSVVVSPERAQAYASEVRKVILSEKLSPADASRIYGKLSFAFCAVCERMLHPLMKPILSRMFSSTADHSLHRVLKASLSACADLVVSLPARSLVFLPTRYIIYSDASWQRKKGFIAACLIDCWQVNKEKRSLGPIAYWKFPVDQSKIFEDTALYPINFLEGCAAVVAMWVWSDLLAGARVDCFIDNCCAEGLLIRMNSGKSHLACLAFQFWQHCSSFQISPQIFRVPSAVNLADLPTKIGFLYENFKLSFDAKEIKLSESIKERINRLLKLEVEHREILLDRSFASSEV
ncbi:unnamed protein product [Amoebophrya sp. A25]|nr:unnamed protein product [Amoebophrya sp. A25]|eukprot:GSA25T00016330001.1